MQSSGNYTSQDAPFQLEFALGGTWGIFGRREGDLWFSWGGGSQMLNRCESRWGVPASSQEPPASGWHLHLRCHRRSSCLHAALWTCQLPCEPSAVCTEPATAAAQSRLSPEQPLKHTCVGGGGGAEGGAGNGGGSISIQWKRTKLKRVLRSQLCFHHREVSISDGWWKHRWPLRHASVLFSFIVFEYCLHPASPAPAPTHTEFSLAVLKLSWA